MHWKHTLQKPTIAMMMVTDDDVYVDDDDDDDDEVHTKSVVGL